MSLDEQIEDILDVIEESVTLPVIDVENVMKLVKEYGGLMQLAVIEDPEGFGIEIPNCDDCDRIDPDDGPRYNEGME